MSILNNTCFLEKFEKTVKSGTSRFCEVSVEVIKYYPSEQMASCFFGSADWQRESLPMYIGRGFLVVKNNEI